ncbi:MAG: alanine racemase [Nitrospirota bacterium]
MNRGAIAEVSLPALACNLQTVRNIVGNRPVIAVVKADAYGHGAVEVSKKLIHEGASSLAVAYAGEAVELRESGIDAPIIVLFDRECCSAFFDLRLTPVIHDIETAYTLSAEAKRRNTILPVHVKIDTGMGRLGLQSSRVVDDLLTIARIAGLEFRGLLTHFSEADLLDRSYALLQLQRFNAVRETLERTISKRIFSHVANSAAVLSFQDAHLDAVRPGIMLYGYSPFGGTTKARKKDSGNRIQETEFADSAKPELQTLSPELPKLIPAMTVKTKILSLRRVSSGTPISYGRTFVTRRPSLIGVIPVGYADGYNRLFSNNADVLVKGKRAPVAGRVCMDLTMVDVTEIEGVSENDEVFIIGRQGSDEITADELAGRANTISYEVLTALGSRSGKRYV